MLLTNYNTVTCPTCSARLQTKNKRTISLIGGIGGGVGGGFGTLLPINWFYTRDFDYLVLFAVLIFIIAFAAWMEPDKFIKLSEKS